VLPAILPRAPVDDILISRHPGGLEGLPAGAVVGSSSPRRALLLKLRRPDLEIVPIRGNVPTRLAKVAAGDAYDATILAAAGLGRLGHDAFASTLSLGSVELFTSRLPWMLPAPGQGAVAVETREGAVVASLLAPLHDPVTAICVETERLLLRRLGGGCHMALGALATHSPGGLSLAASYVPDQTRTESLRTAEATAPTSSEVVGLVAGQLLSP